MLAAHKHSSLLDQFITYEENEVLWICLLESASRVPTSIPLNPPRPHPRHPVMNFSVCLCKEALLKGKALYGWPPCAN
jgi:hypothetical protein